MQENTPYFLSVNPLEGDHKPFEKIMFNSDVISIGRGRTNSIILPILSVSRNHCVIKKSHEDWTIQDLSTFGIDINGTKLGKGNIRKLKNGDIVALEPTKILIYRYCEEGSDVSQPANKKIKLEPDVEQDLINDLKIKFEESQNSEMRYVAEKLYNTQRRQSATLEIKEKLELDYQQKVEQLESKYNLLMSQLNSEGPEAEIKRNAMRAEKDMYLTAYRQEMQSKMEELMHRISKQNNIESELKLENRFLKEKLCQEREAFIAELSKQNFSKQDMLQQLEAKIKSQEEKFLVEREVLAKTLKIETEQMKAAKENELKEIAEQKIRREEELLQQLSFVKQNLEGQVEQMELQRCQAEEHLIIQMNHMKKMSEEDQLKMHQLILERQTIEKKLCEAQKQSEIELKKLKAHVSEREVELAALAADRIQKQAEHSSEVITSLQDQLEKVKSQLELVEKEKKELLAKGGEGSSKQNTLAEVGELMENELQCSVCAELFIKATTLNCSHTFCKFCITEWQKKKNECPICRTPITSECKSLVLDSFIEKMIQNLSEDMKLKREELLKMREELEVDLERQPNSVFECDSSEEEFDFFPSDFDEVQTIPSPGESEEEHHYNTDEYYGYHSDYSGFDWDII